MSLKCCACNSIKPLTEFSGNQKRKEDGPRCLDCTRSMKPVVTSLRNGNAGSNRRCTSCKARKAPSDFNCESLNKCKACSGACRVKDVQRRYGHCCEIPLEAYREAGVAYSWDDYVTKRDVEAASNAWDARSIAHDSTLR